MRSTPIFVIEIMGQTSVSGLFDFLKSKTPYCNVFNFLDFIEQIINKIGNDGNKKVVLGWKEILHHMKKDDILSYMEKEDLEKKDFSKVVVHMHKNFCFVTCGEIQCQKELISFILKVNHVLCFIEFDEEHQTVTYLLPSILSEEAYDNASQCSDRFFTNGILSITIEGNKILSIEPLPKKQQSSSPDISCTYTVC